MVLDLAQSKLGARLLLILALQTMGDQIVPRSPYVLQTSFPFILDWVSKQSHRCTTILVCVGSMALA